MNTVVSTYFGKAHAPFYDERAVKLASVRDSLNFLVRLCLADLPSESRILCVGAGTGAELLDLATQGEQQPRRPLRLQLQV